MTHMLSVADALGGLGHTVLLVTHRPYRRVEGRFRLAAMPPIPYQIKRCRLGERFQVLRLFVHFLGFRPDCFYHRFHWMGWEWLPPARLAKAFRVPRVCEMNAWLPGLDAYLRQDASSARQRRLRYEQGAGAQGIVAAEEADRLRAIDFFHLPPENVVLALNGFDERAIHPRPSGPAVRDGLLRVGALTSAQDYEDFETILRGAALGCEAGLPLRLLLTAKAGSWEGFRAAAARAGLPEHGLELTLPVPHPQLADFFGRLDVGCMAWKPDELKQRSVFASMRLPEYLGSGLCTVATDYPGSPTARLHEQGALVCVPPGEPAALAGALRDLWRDPASRSRIGQAGLGYARRERTWAEVARRTSALMFRVCGG
jgi:glycosyltransferase involved in cell wall biosynthesis